MHIIVDRIKYGGISVDINRDTYIKYIGNSLPVFATVSNISLYDDTNHKLREDKLSDYRRFESVSGSLILTNNPLIEYKTAIDNYNFYVCQARLEDGVIVDPPRTDLHTLDCLPPTLRQYSDELEGYIKPKYNAELREWEEGASEAEIEDWNRSHIRPVSVESRLSAAESAILALMSQS